MWSASALRWSAYGTDVMGPEGFLLDFANAVAVIDSCDRCTATYWLDPERGNSNIALALKLNRERAQITLDRYE
jgi:hypothetical protein